MSLTVGSLLLMCYLPTMLNVSTGPEIIGMSGNNGDAVLEIKVENSTPKVLAISIPKSGTYLLGKLFCTFGFSFHRFNADTSLFIDADELRKLPPMHYTGLHLIALKEHMEALVGLEYKVIFIYRDPRDQIVSAAHYMKNGGALWACSDWPLERIISRLIVDCSLWHSTQVKSGWDAELLKNVGTVKDFYDLYLGWCDLSGIYVTSFEKLVGSKGGGNDSVQYQELQNIALHCDMPLSHEGLLAIQESLFGGTDTFRSGQIGEWKSHFTEQDKEMFKKNAGQLLIDLGYEQDFNW